MPPSTQTATPPEALARLQAAITDRYLLGREAMNAAREARGEYKSAANLFTQDGYTDAHREADTALIGSLPSRVLFTVLLLVPFAILGYFFGMEFDALFVTALLTIIGFSVHDTIVVFDRIRENRIRHAGEPFGAIVNHSILQTAGRSIITSLTVVVPLAALLLLGPPTIRTFALALLLVAVLIVPYLIYTARAEKANR